MTRFFDLMKAKLDFEPVLHWTNLLTFPGWLSPSRGREMPPRHGGIGPIQKALPTLKAHPYIVP